MPQPLSLLTLSDEDQIEALERGGVFTDMTRSGVRTWPLSQVALLVKPNAGLASIIEIGSVTRSRQRIATGWHRLRYVRRRRLSQPIDVGWLLNTLPERVLDAVENRVNHGGVLTKRGTDAVIEAINEVNPDDGQVLRKLVAEDGDYGYRLRGAGLQAAAHEADAVRLALDIAGVPRTELRDVRPDGELSFLEQLDYVRSSEDTTIAYDGMRFLDFDRIESPSGIVVFQKGNERLAVVNVNRGPLERTTGADLIYINESFESFVLVQYKAMRREGSDPESVLYRPDQQLNVELERMRKIRVGADDGLPASYRLNPATCFLKLCKPIVRLDRIQGLVSGMYLPLDYYDVLTASSDVRGERGGTVLGYHTVHRHVSNDLFVSLVRGGWVGSRGASTRKLEDLVRSGLSADRSVTVAASSTVNHLPAPRTSPGR